MRANQPVLTRVQRVTVFVSSAAGSFVFLKVQGLSLISAVPQREWAGALLPFILLAAAMGAIAGLAAAGVLVGGGALWSISRARFLKVK